MRLCSHPDMLFDGRLGLLRPCNPSLLTSLSRARGQTRYSEREDCHDAGALAEPSHLYMCVCDVMRVRTSTECPLRSLSHAPLHSTHRGDQRDKANANAPEGPGPVHRLARDPEHKIKEEGRQDHGACLLVVALVDGADVLWYKGAVAFILYIYYRPGKRVYILNLTASPHYSSVPYPAAPGSAGRGTGSGRWPSRAGRRARPG